MADGELARAIKRRDDFLSGPYQKAKRAEWLSLVTEFEKAAEAQPKAGPAARARLYGAELAFTSYGRFKQAPDLARAAKLSRLAVRGCPRCPEAARAQLLVGKCLLEEKKTEEAWRELLKVELNYPGSLEASQAKGLLDSLKDPSPPSGSSASAAKPPKAPAANPPVTEPSPSLAQGKTPPSPPKSPNGPGQEAIKPVSKESPPKARAKITPPVKAPPARSDGLAQVYAITLEDMGSYTEITAFSDRVSPYLYNMLPPSRSGGAYRVYADFKDSRLWPGAKDRLNGSTPLVRLVKLSQLDKNTVRLVADLTQAHPYQPLFLENPARLVIRVAKEVQNLPGPEAEAPPEAPEPTAPKKAPEPKKDEKKSPAKPSSPPARGPSDSMARQLGLKIRRVIIDPGHGGKDGGAAGNGIVEKDICLRAAKKLASKIKSRLKLEVVLTRETDKFVTLDRRTRISKDNKGDLFISLHANSNSLPKVEGLETYILNFASDKTAMTVAARENAAADKSMAEMGSILELIAKNTKVAESRVLAKSLHSKALAALRTKHKTRDLGVKEAVFVVLLNVDVPSVLVEMGFLSNPQEAARLNSEAYLELITDGLTDGLKAYIAGLP
jgi:N-acetylmuramoyl-L-alanine amidase